MSLPDWIKRAGDHIIIQLFDDDDDSTIKILDSDQTVRNEILSRGGLRLSERSANLPSTPSNQYGTLYMSGNVPMWVDDGGTHSPLLDNLTGTMLSLPGLRGLWTMASFDESGNALDISGNGRTLTYAGNPTYSANGLLPYIVLDGTGDWLTRADEAALSITGAETYVATAEQGLTIHAVVYFDATGSNDTVLAKWDSGTANRSYRIFKNDSDLIKFQTFDGTTADLVGTTEVAAETYYHIVGRFDPSTEIATFVNNVKVANTTSIPAAIDDTTEALSIGADSDNGYPTPGRIGMVGLYAAKHTDAQIAAVFQQLEPLL